MSTLRITNIEAKADPSSPTVDEKIKLTNSNGDILVHIDGKTSGITTIGINTTAGNIKFDQNSNVVVTGIITATKFVGTIEPTTLTVGGDLTIPDKIVHTGDTNTSIRFPAADTITAETGGSERLRILSDGKVAIGGVTANSLLDVHGGDGISITHSGDTFLQSRTTGATGTNYLEFKDSGGASGAISYHHNGDSLRFKVNGSERLRVANDGNVSIGSPSSGGWKLKVVVDDNASYQSAVNISNNVNADFTFDIKSNEVRVGPSVAIPLLIKTGNTEKVRIESDGQVVINRSSGAVLADSSSKLEVYNATENHIFVANSTAATGQDAGIMFGPANNVYGGKIIVTSDEDFSNSANRTAHMAFHTRKDGTASEKLRITSSGAVNLSTPSSSIAAGLLNLPNGSRLSSGVTPRGTYATGNGGVVDMARYEMISRCITSFPANNSAICAINGAPLYINDSRDTWDRYYALPNYLLGTVTHDCINNSSFNITLACTMTVFMGRSSTWNAVNTSGWNLIESNTSIGPFSATTRLYVKTLAAGTHSLDNDSAMYFFSL